MPGKANNIPFKSTKWDRRSLYLNSLHVHLSKMWRCLSEHPDPGVSDRDTGSSMGPLLFFHRIGIINVLFPIVWELISDIVPVDADTGSQ